MDIGFTGTKSGMSKAQMATLLSFLDKFVCGEFHHGDCLGADSEAHVLASATGYRIVVHPPENPKARAYCKYDEIWGPKPYLDRNKDIVDRCHVLIAAPHHDLETLRSGTWATVRYARRKQKPIILLERNLASFKCEGCDEIFQNMPHIFRVVL